MMVLKAALVWMACMIGAMANGGLREFVINPWIGNAWGHVLSTVLLAVIILCITWATITWMGPATAGQGWAIGMGWVCMTLAFEFGFGHYIRMKSWSELFADYHLLEGRIWVLVPIVTLLAPWWTGRMRGLFD